MYINIYIYMYMYIGICNDNDTYIIYIYIDIDIYIYTYIYRGYFGLGMACWQRLLGQRIWLTWQSLAASAPGVLRARFRA